MITDSLNFSPVMFEYAKNEIVLDIAIIKGKLESIAKRSENVRNTDNRESLEFLLIDADDFVTWAKLLSRDIKSAIYFIEQVN